MELMELIRSRRSIRKYSDQPIEQEKIDLILEAIRLSPSALNRQEWKFFVVKDKDIIRAVADSAEIFEWLYNVPAILVGASSTHEFMTNGHNSDSIDVSIAMSFAMLEATELGLGTCWMAHYDQKKIRRALDMAENLNPTVLMPFGYAAEQPMQRNRKPIEEIVVYR